MFLLICCSNTENKNKFWKRKIDVACYTRRVIKKHKKDCTDNGKSGASIL